MHELPVECAEGPYRRVVAGVRGRLQESVVPGQGFSFGFDEGREHTTVQVIPQRAADRVELAPGYTWVADDGVLA